MNHSIYCANRQKHQRRLNKYVRELNKNIEQDNLWHGRFVVRQYATQWYRFEDGSGYELYATLLFIDKKNGRIYTDRMTANEWCMWNGSKLWYTMNEFITKYDDVWSAEGRDALYTDKTDYTKIPIPNLKNFDLFDCWTHPYTCAY